MRTHTNIHHFDANILQGFLFTLKLIRILIFILEECSYACRYVCVSVLMKGYTKYTYIKMRGYANLSDPYHMLKFPLTNKQTKIVT